MLSACQIHERERERERERDIDENSVIDQSASTKTPSISTSDTSAMQHSVDLLFDRTFDQSSWESAKAPQVLGELLDSRYMLPLFLPSDPRVLSAAPVKRHIIDLTKRASTHQPESRIQSRIGTVRSMGWKCRSYRVREVSVDTLRWLDSFQPSRWARPTYLESSSPGNVGGSPSLSPISDTEDLPINASVVQPSPHSTPLTRKPSTRSKNRTSLLGDQFAPLAPPL